MRASTRSILLIVIAALAGAFAGCERDEAPIEDEPQGEETDEVDIFDERGDLVAYGGDVELTIEDVERAVERTRLVASGVEDGQIPDEAPEWIKMPHAQGNLVRQLVHFQIVRQAAAERGIDITAADETSKIAGHDQLQRYLPLFQNGDGADELRSELAEFGLDIDDVRHLAHDMILHEKLQDALAEEFSEDRLWAIYQEAMDTADLVVATLHNSPTSSEIDRAVRQYDRQIRSHFRENRDRYVRPSRVRATILTAESGEEGLQEAAGRLEDGEEATDIGEDLGLEVRSNVPLSRHRTPEAHEDGEVGDIGITTTSDRNSFVWQIDETAEPERRSLDRPLRREIGSRVLRNEEGITPSNRQRADEARQLLSEPETEGPMDEPQIEQLLDELEQRDFEAVHTGHFSIRQAPRIPQIGLAEDLQEAVQQLDFDNPVTDAVLQRDKIYVARLVDRAEPDRDTYEDERAEFREQFMERNRGQLIQQLIHDYQRDHELEVSVAPISEHYGVIGDKTELQQAPDDIAPDQAPIPDEDAQAPAQ